MRILAIDPGDKQSAYVILEHKTLTILDKGIIPNDEMLLGFRGDPDTFFNCYYDVACIEYPAPRGMPMWSQLVDTIYWIGRFDQAAGRTNFVRIDRKDVKMALCGSAKAKDANIRFALMDMFKHKAKQDSKAKIPVIGTAGNAGPLYGISKDMWAALGVAMTYVGELGTKNYLQTDGEPIYKQPPRRTRRSYCNTRKQQEEN